MWRSCGGGVVDFHRESLHVLQRVSSDEIEWYGLKAKNSSHDATEMPSSMGSGIPWRKCNSE
jgi:hypothetical protein